MSISDTYVKNAPVALSNLSSYTIADVGWAIMISGICFCFWRLLDKSGHKQNSLMSIVILSVISGGVAGAISMLVRVLPTIV